MHSTMASTSTRRPSWRRCSGGLLSFGLWLLYFDRLKGQGQRTVADVDGGRRLRLWAYGHVPLYMGIASLAAGTVALSAPGTLSPASAALYVAGLALAAAGLGLLARAKAPDFRA